MNVMVWLDSAFAVRCATTLLHFLWQGCVVGVLVIAAGALLRRAPAQWRYLLNVAALLLMAACLPLTFMTLDAQRVRSAAVVEHGPDVPYVFGAAADSDHPGTLTHANLGSQADWAVVPAPESLLRSSANFLLNFVRPIAPYVTGLYFVCVALMLGRLAMGVWGGHRLRQSAMAIDDALLIATVGRQARQVGLRVAPAVGYCQQVSIPVVIGVMKPMILLPAALAGGLSPDQLQALITHELAHVRRLDLAVNLLQRLIEAVLFFHPVVWLVSRRINLERENAADDMVLAAGWQRPHYADALVRMAELSLTLRNARCVCQTALAASGGSSSELKRRVMRLLNVTEATPVRLTRTGLAVLAAMLVTSACVPPVMHAWAQQPADSQHVEKKNDPTTSIAKETQPQAVVRVGSGTVPGSSVAPTGSDQMTAPLRVSAPKGSAVSWPLRSTNPDDHNVYTGRIELPVTLAELTGITVAFELIDLPKRGDLKLFGSIEVLSVNSQTSTFLKDHAKNAIPIEFSEEEIEQAARGKLVTKAIYLPKKDVKSTPTADKSPETTRREPETDPVAEAKRRGHLLAIARLGNRRTVEGREEKERDAGRPGPSDPPKKDGQGKQGKKPATGDSSTPDVKAAASKPEGVTFVVTQHVILHEGKIVAWDDVEKILDEAAKKGKIYPQFYTTNGGHGREKKLQGERSQLYKRLYDAKKIDGMGIGFLSPRAGERLDRIKTPADLAPDAAKKLTGRITDVGGKPLAGVEVFLLPEEHVNGVYLRDGRNRNPLEEHLTHTDATGQFATYPEVGESLLVAAHPDGFAIATIAEFRKSGSLQLKAWARVFGDRPAKGDDAKQSVHFTSYPVPGISFSIYETVIAADGRFDQKFIPPGKVIVSRSLPKGNGSSMSFPVESPTLAPGQSHQVEIGPIPDTVKGQLMDFDKLFPRTKPPTTPQ